MNVLFISALLPYPLHSGGQIRIYNLLKRLSKNHTISLFSFIRSEDERQHVKNLSFCKNVTMVMRGHAWQPSYITKSLFGSYPFLMETYHNSEMEKLLADAVNQHDVIHIEPGYVWPSLPVTKTPIVVAEHNVEHMVYESYVNHFSFVPLRPFLSFDVAKLKKWEKIVWEKARAIVAVSDKDKITIESISGKNVSLVPNGVDVRAFSFKPNKDFNFRFLYTGNFKWMENRDAASYLQKTIWPAVVRAYPNATLRIIGKGAPDGEVRDIKTEYEKADVLIAPIRIGGGTKFKILEAMALGIPVITTSRGAQGLDSSALWIAENQEETLARIKEIIENRDKTKKARSIVEKYYNWDTIAKSLDTVWNSLS